ncbi:hypothetical protein GCM10025783_30500 [Amnibacterium soli]|uniref:Ammonia permease n=1 Tax=Amnibacterium soli TaxID=1282736 RepID=A0ABP8ZFQ7_9MICO
MLLAAGALVGVLAKLADSWGRDAASLNSTPAVWILALCLIARLTTSPVRAAAGAAGFFLGMLAGYYGTTLIVLHYLVTPRLLVAWTIAAITVCPGAAALLHLASRSGRLLVALPIGVAAGLVFIDHAVQGVLISWQQPDFVPFVHPVQAGFDLATALVIVLGLPRGAAIRVLGSVVGALTALLLLPVVEGLTYGSGLLG